MSKLRGLIIGLIVLFVVALPNVVLAAQDPIEQACAVNPSSPVCQTNDDNPIFGPIGILTRATVIISFIVGVASVIMIIINGFKFVLSNGNAESVSSARRGLLFAIIGLIIALSAQAIVLLILRRL